MPIKVAKSVDLGYVHKCMHKVHAFLHSQGEGWGHRVYLGLVGVEVKYWYGKAALVILAIEGICWLLSFVDKE